MGWREALDDANGASALEALLAEVQQSRQELLGACETALDQTKDFEAAVSHVRALMFIDKFALDLHQRLDQFE